MSGKLASVLGSACELLLDASFRGAYRSPGPCGDADAGVRWRRFLPTVAAWVDRGSTFARRLETEWNHSLPVLEPLRSFCAEHDIAYEELRFSPADHALGIVNSPLDTHANRKGHDLLLQRLRQALQRRHLLPQ